MESAKKEELLRACLAEFAEHGYEKGNTNRICDAAGVSKGLLFHYFGSKRDLYLLCVRRCVDDLLRIFEPFSTEGLGFTESLAAYGRAKIGFYLEHPLHYRIVAGAFLATPKEVRRELSQQFDELNRYAWSVVGELIGRVPLRPGVTKEQAVELIRAVSGAAERKYIPQILGRAECDADFYSRVQEDYLRMMRLALYGIAEPPTPEGLRSARK